MPFRRLAAASASLSALLLAAPPLAAPALPSLDAPDLAKGSYSSMHMLLQKTILKVNVATIDVRVDPKTQSRFTELARGKAYSDGLAHQLALAAIDASRAVVQMQFKRDVSLDRWMGVVRDNLEQARKAGLITAEVEKRVGQSLPQWFGALRDRGYEKGDRLIYSVMPDGVRSVVVSTAGQVLVDRMDADRGAPRVVLGSYFATGSEFREPLLRSLFEAPR
jgi:hypothetical protein